ncbi:MAG: zinc ribbon domain-containing protein [Actinobacteria bacterium]|jgi:putative FmdB family regulatory protein|nr:MAG: zinc ribbon domain-containing protein [Actinomycetota bacterium]
MPIYEYKCPSCGHLFEVLRKVSDSPDGKCPRCKKQAKRVFHPVGVIFKGTGFYSTDNKKKNSKPTASPSKESSSGGESSTDPVVQKRIDTA